MIRINEEYRETFSISAIVNGNSASLEIRETAKGYSIVEYLRGANGYTNLWKCRDKDHVCSKLTELSKEYCQIDQNKLDDLINQMRNSTQKSDAENYKTVIMPTVKEMISFIRKSFTARKKVSHRIESDYKYINNFGYASGVVWIENPDDGETQVKVDIYTDNIEISVYSQAKGTDYETAAKKLCNDLKSKYPNWSVNIE